MCAICLDSHMGIHRYSCTGQGSVACDLWPLVARLPISLTASSAEPFSAMDKAAHKVTANPKAVSAGHIQRGWKRPWNVREETASVGIAGLALTPDLLVEWPEALGKVADAIRSKSFARMQGVFVCTCGKSFQSRECQAAAECCLPPAKLAVKKALVGAKPRWSLVTGGGTTLKPGEACPNRGNDRG